MAIFLDLRARDVTLLPDERPAPDFDAAPERSFNIYRGPDGYRLEFDGRHAMVPRDAILNLLARVSEGTSVEWRYSKDPAIQATFRPLNRIIQSINSTPAYQLFLAGFHIGDTIGMFEPAMIAEPAVVDSFRYLVGNLPWPQGKKGRLFFLPEDYVTADAEQELRGNGKLFSVDLYTGDGDRRSHVTHKVCVPYATPMGFNTKIVDQTENAWRRVSELIRRQGSGVAT